MKHDFLRKPLVGCLLAAAWAHAGATAMGQMINDFRTASKRGQSTTFVQIDNDSLLLNRDDGFFTSGARIGQTYSQRDTAQMTIFGWRIGQELYTASDIKLPPALVRPPDHPYAGWLFGGFFRELHGADGSFQKLGIDIGCLGPCAGGEWTQTNLHRLLHQPQPRGWSRQVKNEAGVVLYADVAPVRWPLGHGMDATPDLHGRFGNIFTDAGAGMTVRAGRLNALPEEPTLHGFLRVDASAVAYNATLQGGYFSTDNPHTVRPKRFVGEAELGVMWRRGPYGLNASIVRRGNEIRDLPNSIGAQNFARLIFSYSPGSDR